MLLEVMNVVTHSRLSKPCSSTRNGFESSSNIIPTTRSRSTCCTRTTATMKKPVNGTAIMRQFKAGMGVFGNSLNPLWQKVLRDRQSGKSPDDLWLAFLRAYEAERNTKRKRLVSFVVEKVEKNSWILVYKHLGPPASTLYEREVLEEIVAPNRFQYRGTGRDARREGKLSRAVHREEQQAVREHHTRTARTSHQHDMMYKIGVEQTVQQAMNGIVSQMSMKRQMLALALEHVDNGADKARLVQQLMIICQEPPTSREQLREAMFGMDSNTPQSTPRSVKSWSSGARSTSPVKLNFDNDTGDTGVGFDNSGDEAVTTVMQITGVVEPTFFEWEHEHPQTNKKSTQRAQAGTLLHCVLSGRYFVLQHVGIYGNLKKISGVWCDAQEEEVQVNPDFFEVASAHAQADFQRQNNAHFKLKRAAGRASGLPKPKRSRAETATVTT